MLYDKAKFKLIAGKGGDGIVSFRRAKFEPKGGPDGGNGGDGGSILIKATSKLADLAPYASKEKFKAENGEPGGKNERTGKSGEDLVLKVPVGTVVYKLKDNRQKKIVDLKKPDQKELIIQGGRGGRGNTTFKSSTNQAPKKATKGESGEEETILLKYKIIADFGLIGQPNVGKSTLLSVISRAQPKIADYPFTTLDPNLGVVEHKGQKLVAADIPGLIKNAHQGKGLGDKFLAHIERCQLLVHLIDAGNDDSLSSYQTIREELSKYGNKLKEKDELIVLNKIDLIDDKQLKKKIDKLNKEINKEIFAISAVKKDGIDSLLDKIIEMI